MKRFLWIVANALDVAFNCNDQRGSYLTAAQELEQNPTCYSDMGDELKVECIEKNSLCTLQIYPDTPVGFVCFQHWDPEVCVERAYRWLRKERGAVDDGALPIEDAGPHPKDSE